MALTDSLISHWAMDEASGDATDSHGSNTLTETSGTIASATGKVGNARDFESGDTEYFERADNADLSTGDIDFTVAGWFRAESISAFSIIFCKDDNSTEREYGLYVNNSGQMEFYLSSNGTGATVVTATTFGVITTNTWYFFVCWHDSINNVRGISVNDVANTNSYSSGVRDGTAPFNIGARGPTSSLYWDGLIDEVSFWKRVLTSGERTTLYNGGSGLAYPWSVATGSTRLIGGKLTNPLLVNPRSLVAA